MIGGRLQKPAIVCQEGLRLLRPWPSGRPQGGKRLVMIDMSWRQSQGDQMSSISPAVAAFIADIESLCKKHGLMLSASGYDGLQVWKLDDGERPLHFDGVEDCTGMDSGPPGPKAD